MYQNVKTSIYAYIDHQTESIIDNNLEDYLKSIGKANFFNNLSYILKEVVGNANKANLKRAYFHLNDLDIKSSIHYDEGMRKFKENISSFSSQYITAISKLGLYVKIDLFVEKNYFVMSVTNSCPILPIEKKEYITE
ncbi:MAG: hypothetical protein KAT05_10430 [Spirochaetes bacterium]|nr:hypothetical protein [Spirochaetota bacterium]